MGFPVVLDDQLERKGLYSQMYRICFERGIGMNGFVGRMSGFALELLLELESKASSWAVSRGAKGKREERIHTEEVQLLDLRQ